MATERPTPQSTGGSNILGAAFLQYGIGTGSKSNVPTSQVVNPSAQYEYGQPGRTGKDTDGDGFREVDCSVLVFNGLRNAGYNIPGVVANSESINFTTSTLFSTPVLGKGTLSDAAKQNFNKIEESDLKPGDIVLFSPTKAGNAQHMGIFYGYNEQGQMLFYGSQSTGGPGIEKVVDTGEKLSYFGGAGAKFFTALRPKPELYVPEMDLTGGAGTGLSSDKVIAAVNLLKNDNVEGFRANIYSDNTAGKGDGVPTVGNGLALVVKGANGWIPRPENEMRDLLRDAGLPESKYNELPLDKIKESANLLNQGKLTEARAVFGTGEGDGFSVTPAEADKLSASFVIRNVIPSMVKSFGDAESFGLLEPGEFAAAASKVYQNPNWLSSAQGKKFLDAWWSDDDTAAKAALGTGIRGSAEASAYDGNISTGNENLTVGASKFGEAPVGHWEEVPAQTDPLTGYETAPAARVWVGSLEATTTQSASTTANAATPKPLPINSLQDSDVNTVPADPAKPDGEQLTITSMVGKDGKLITVVSNSDGEIILTAQPGQTLNRDPETGKLTVTAADGATKSYNPVTAEFESAPAPEATPTKPSEGNASASQSTQDLAGSTLVEGSVDTTQTTTTSHSETNNVLVGSASTTALQKIPLAGGGYLVANEDGDIVSSGTPVGRSGVMQVTNSDGTTHFENARGQTMTSLQATVFEATGVDLTTPPAYDKDLQGALSGVNAGVAFSNAINNWSHLTDLQRASALLTGYNNATNPPGQINTGGEPSPYTPREPTLGSQLGGALNLLMSVQQIGNWDQMSDMARAQALSSLVSSGNSLALSFKSGDANFGQSMGEFAAGLSFADALAHGGDRAIITSGLQFANAFDGAADQVISNWVGSTTGTTVPYVGIALAVLSFEQNPGAAIGSLVGNYFGGPIGGMIGSAVLGGMFGGSKPPPPEGEIHFEWNAQSGLRIVMDKDVGGAGANAQALAASVQSMMEGVVGGANEKSRQAMASGEPAQALIALNPFKLPRMGVTMAGAWIEVMQGDGTVIREDIHNETFATRITAILQDSGALTSQWEVDTVKAHYSEEVQTNPAEALAHARAGMGGHAGAGNQAFALQGNAVEAADFKTQSFGALVVHAQAASGLAATLEQIKTLQVITNADQDSYLEQSEWVSGTDESGNPQGVLVLDFNGDGLIETRDILNLGGNVGQDGNNTDEARQATANGALQRNNANWLDANGDHILDARDPAFAAIKLLIDINNNGRADDGELQSLDQASITAINLTTGQVQYADGHTDALTATRLTAQTSGDKQTQIQEVQADGTVKTFDAGQVIEHEGYTGQVQITDDGGTRWVGQRNQTYDQQALRTGDWEGTAEAEAHRHGGGNVEGTPTETTATGTISLGKVKTVEQKPNAVQTVTVTTGAALGFIPLAAFAGTTQSTIEQVTSDMIQSAGSTMFGGAAGSSSGAASGGAGLGALGAVGAGMGSGAPVVASVVNSPQSSANNGGPPPTAQAVQPNANNGATGADTGTQPVVFVAAGISNFQSAPVVVSTAASTPAPTTATIATVIAASPSPQPSPAGGEGVVAAPVRATVVSVTPAASSPAPTPTPTPAPIPTAPVLQVPTLQSETLAGAEDGVFRLSSSTLLANDTSANAANPSQPVLTITSVANPTHGQVGLNNGVNGLEVVFIPDTNFHGTATFSYTVTDQYGLQSTATATLLIAAVNDVPVATGETASNNEDTAIIFTQAQLLANDSDVDTATDGQTLSISAVLGATNGAVVMLANGDIRFTPNANYHGAAQFTYTVSDSNGGTANATVNLTVLGVNDAPVAAGEALNGAIEDTTLLIAASTLLANDTDVDTATDGQVLSIQSVSGATHGTVSLITLANGTQQINFVPDANYNGAAQFSYTVTDGNGATSTAIATLNVAAVNDAPITANESAQTDEDVGLLFTQAQLLANDTDVDTATDGQVLSVSRVGLAQHGTALMDAQGQVRFVADANYHGAASFTYWVSDSSGGETPATVNVTVLAVNDAPVATGEALSGAVEDTTLLIAASTLLANDTDVDTATDGQVLSIQSVSGATHGTVSLITLANGSQQINFVPDANYNGAAQFSYTVTDSNGATSTAIATLQIAAVNDAPDVIGETITGQTEDTALLITAAALLQNDSDVDNAQGTLTLSRVQSGTGGTATLNANGSVSFVPTANFNGNATFTYWVRDPAGLESNPVTTTIVITAVNDAPAAQGEVVNGALEDAIFTIPKASLLTNDSDVDNANSELIIGWVGSATGGTVSIHASGDVVFTPTANFNGNATFQYRLRDPSGLESPNVTAVIPVTAVNDAPVGVDDQFTTYKNSTMTIAYNQLTGNDTDVDGDALTVGGVRNAVNGAVSIVGGQVRFVPTSGYTGAASFQYLVDDSHGGQTWANAAVQVTVPPNQYPTVTVTGAGFDWYNSAYHEVRSAGFSFAVNDDSNPAAVSMRLNSATYATGYGSWEASQGISLSRSGASGSISMAAGSMQYDYDLGYYWGPIAYYNYAYTSWTLVDDRGLTNTMYLNVDYSGSNYNISFAHSGYYYPPVVLDLNGNGVQFTSINDSKFAMDVNFDGIADTMAWAGNDDGVLVWDKDYNQQITDASEIGFHKLKEGAQTDLEGLQALDTNGNGLLDAGDEKFTEFAVWQDANGNGFNDAGEFKTLTQQGITSINLHSNAQVQEVVDVMVMGEATFTRTDGSTGAALDVMLAYQPGQAAMSEQANINRMALLFNNAVNTAVDIELPSLGYVPIGMESADPHVQDFANLQGEHSNKT